MYIIIYVQSRAGIGWYALAARLTPTFIGAYFIMPKRLRREHLGRRSQTSHRREHSINHPRPLTDRERTLIFLYSYCQLGMTPQQFYAKWDVTYEDIALICCRSHSAVRRWFQRGHRHRSPHANDLRHLALMDFMLEHFEEIPKPLFDMLCFPR